MTMSSYQEIEFNLLKEKYDIDFLIVTATPIELEKSIEHLHPFEDEIIKTYHAYALHSGRFYRCMTDC